MRKIVYVKGNILITKKDLDHSNFVAGKAKESDFDTILKNATIIYGDLVIDDAYQVDQHVTYIGAESVVSTVGIYFAENADEIMDTYQRAIHGIEQIINIEIIDGQTSFARFKLAFIGVFGSMEAFLCDIFQFHIKKKEQYIINYIDNRKKHINLNAKDEARINESIQSFLYHNLWKAKGLFEGTFGISFPNIRDVNTYMDIRHDFVHRNGRTKNGEKVSVDKYKVLDLIEKVNTLVNAVADEFKKIDS